MAALVAGGALPAAAQTTAFPSRPVRLIVPHAPGGNSDTFGRILALKLGERLKPAGRVENRPGAGGTLASAMAAKSPADGYTLVVADNGTHAIAPTLYGAKLTYDVFRISPHHLGGEIPDRDHESTRRCRRKSRRSSSRWRRASRAGSPTRPPHGQWLAS